MMDRILMYYLRVSQHLSQQFRTHLGKLELTFPQALALSTLNDQGTMPMSKRRPAGEAGAGQA